MHSDHVYHDHCHQSPLHLDCDDRVASQGLTACAEHERKLQEQAHLRLGDRTIHAGWLLIHEGYRLALLVFALLFSAEVAQSLDILLLSFILLLQELH